MSGLLGYLIELKSRTKRFDVSFPRFSCNCPDFTGKQPANAGASALSNQVARAWDGGMQKRGKYCKHIIRVIVELGLEKQWGIPNDLRSPAMEKYKGRNMSPKLQKTARLGDDFS